MYLSKNRYIIGHDAGNWLKIDSRTGEIQFSREFDKKSKYITNGIYTAEILAIDGKKIYCQFLIKLLLLHSIQVTFFFFSFIFICWRLITLQYCSGFCHTLTWISHGFTCVPHPDPPLPSSSPSHPSGSSQCTSSEHLSHASNLGQVIF